MLFTMHVHLIDGTYELFRAHFSKRPDHKAKAGWDAKATFGVLQSLIALMRDPLEKATHLAIAFDNPIVSFRNRLFDGYKTDEGIDPALRSQFDAVEEACRALGVCVWSMNEFEADDALATGAAKYGAISEVEQVRILTPDKDLNQCLHLPKVIQVDRMRQRVITAETCRNERGIEPQSVPDYLALVGDTADGIPGLKGWGEKSAASVLAAYRKIEAIPALARDWSVTPRGADKLAQELSTRREDALLYRTLATLRVDVPLEQSLEDLRYKGPTASWREQCEKLNATELFDRPPGLAA